MTQKPTTNIQIFSHGNNYENGRCICIAENVENDTHRKIIIMSQSNFANGRNQYFGKHTNIHGIPKHVFEDSFSPVRLALKTYV